MGHSTFVCVPFGCQRRRRRRHPPFVVFHRSFPPHRLSLHPLGFAGRLLAPNLLTLIGRANGGGGHKREERTAQNGCRHSARGGGLFSPLPFCHTNGLTGQLTSSAAHLPVCLFIYSCDGGHLKTGTKPTAKQPAHLGGGTGGQMDGRKDDQPSCCCCCCCCCCCRSNGQQRLWRSRERSTAGEEWLP
jgi:hypothetical protein